MQNVIAQLFHCHGWEKFPIMYQRYVPSGYLELFQLFRFPPFVAFINIH